MVKHKVESLETEIIRIAALLRKRDDALNKEEVRRALESAGIDQARVMARLHEGALRLAEELRRDRQMVSLALQQAIAATEPSAALSRRARPKHRRPSR